MSKNRIVPYNTSDKTKKEQIATMFDTIAGTYDFLNHFLSFGVDRRWRKKAINVIGNLPAKNILDVACGTGDFALQARTLNPKKIIGIDISKEMVHKGNKKIKTRNLESQIELTLGDAEKIKFPDNYFNVAMSAFGVRNFENLNAGLSEMHRVLENEGRILILEFSKPPNIIIKQFYYFYFNNLLPLLARIVSTDKYAYKYLPNSVNNFVEGQEFLTILKQIGFSDVVQIPLTFGIASIYTGVKKK